MLNERGQFWEQYYGSNNGGFKERAARTTGVATYVYDANGNLIQDKNKGLTITYNYLNLPQTMTFDGTNGNAGGTIDFTYDATGKKWRKTVTGTRQCAQIRDYIDGVEYTGSSCGISSSSFTPDIIHFSDGYIQRDPSTDGNYSWMGWVYKYALTDHLGNTRVVFSDKDDDGIVGVTDIEQINNYYPFGLNMDGPWNGVNGAFKFQYNQKEWNSDLGLNLNDYGARFYDPTVGRWNGVDAMSEKSYSWTPYRSFFNNPIRFYDKDGQYEIDPAFAKEYPMITKYIRTNITRDVMKSDLILKAFQESTKQTPYSEGTFNSHRVWEALQDKNGPKLIAVDNPGGLIGETVHGKFHDNTNTIELKNSDLKKVEAILKDPEATFEDKQKALLPFYQTLLHETTHYGDYLDGQQQDGKNSEPGGSFEDAVWNWYTDLKTLGVQFLFPEDKYTLEGTNKRYQEAKKTKERSDTLPTPPKSE